MRRFFVVFLVLLLAGCAGGSAAHLAAPAVIGTAVAPNGPPLAPELTHQVLIADDGVKLPLRTWLPEGKPSAVILALHGFNDYSNAFALPAPVWAKDGIATFAYDQRGFGAAPKRGLWPGSYRLAKDLTTATQLLHKRYPGVPIYCLGESMGGAVVAAAVSGAAGAPKPHCDGIILAAPAVWGRDTMNVFERMALWTGDALFPSMTVTGRGLNIWPSDNIPMLRLLSRDPLVIKETRIDTIEGLVNLMDKALASAPRITVPMLLLYGGQDQIVPAEPTRLFIRDLPYKDRATRKIAWYPRGYHMLLRDLEGPVVWRDIESWIADHHAALPSGADQNASEELFAAR